MRVEMTTRIGGYRNGVEWPEPGGIVDVPDHEALDLFAAGYAKEATADAEANTKGAEDDSDGDPAEVASEATKGDDGEPAPADAVKPKGRTRR